MPNTSRPDALVAKPRTTGGDSAASGDRQRRRPSCDAIDAAPVAFARLSRRGRLQPLRQLIKSLHGASDGRMPNPREVERPGERASDVDVDAPGKCRHPAHLGRRVHDDVSVRSLMSASIIAVPHAHINRMKSLGRAAESSIPIGVEASVAGTAAARRTPRDPSAARPIAAFQLEPARPPGRAARIDAIHRIAADIGVGAHSSFAVFGCRPRH